jgi:hypothetical protein
MSTVTADVTVTVNVQDSTTGGTLASASTVNYQETAKINYNATSPNTSITKEWSGLLTLVASTPQSLDLTTLTGPYGSTVTFASVAGIYLYNNGAHSVLVGNSGTNDFLPGWSSATHVETINANSRWVKENNGTAWTVDSTHKILKFDPSTTATTVRVIVIGN